MFLQKLSLINFKNYHEAELSFSEKINCFVGNNGEGKTNLLDAIYYLSFCKSYFNAMDSQNILNEAPFFVIQGTYVKDESIPDVVYCSQKRNQRKQFKINKKEYERLADHIGLFPLVMISPADSELITGGSEERRKYIDSVISQFDKFYLDDLLNYNKALYQRNSLLKRFAESRSFEKESLEIWDKQLVELGNRIHSKRSAFLESFIGIFSKYYEFVSGGKEKVNIIYDSQLHSGEFKKLLDNSLDRDRALLYTTVGIHKDDLSFWVEKYPLKKFGSQGQQKSFIIGMKLAQFDYMKDIKGYKPVLLFDDIFDKLDHLRVEQLMKLVSQQSFGQVFITDTHPERIAEVFKNIDTECRIFEIINGTAQLKS
jgi:DNA replication and repair protein RecF